MVIQSEDITMFVGMLSLSIDIVPALAKHFPTFSKVIKGTTDFLGKDLEIHRLQDEISDLKRDLEEIDKLREQVEKFRKVILGYRLTLRENGIPASEEQEAAFEEANSAILGLETIPQKLEDCKKAARWVHSEFSDLIANQIAAIKSEFPGELGCEETNELRTHLECFLDWLQHGLQDGDYDEPSLQNIVSSANDGWFKYYRTAFDVLRRKESFKGLKTREVGYIKLFTKKISEEF